MSSGGFLHNEHATHIVSSFIYNLGRQIGRKALPTIRKSKYLWDGVTGTEEEAFRAELRLGEEMAAELRSTFHMANEPSTVLHLNEISDALAAQVKEKRRTFLCEVFMDPFPNAIALPGGRLFLSDSMLSLCDRERDELAFVLGHEIAHIVLGHTWDRMFNETVLRAAALATSRVGQLGAWLHQRGFALLRNAHAREQELAADDLGWRLAAAAGFPRNAAQKCLQRMAVLETDKGALGEYLGSHPAAQERINRLRALAAPNNPS